MSFSFTEDSRTMPSTSSPPRRVIPSSSLTARSGGTTTRTAAPGAILPGTSPRAMSPDMGESDRVKGKEGGGTWERARDADHSPNDLRAFFLPRSDGQDLAVGDLARILGSCEARPRLTASTRRSEAPSTRSSF